MADDFTDKLRPLQPSGPSVLSDERNGSNVDVKGLARHLLSRNGFLSRQQRVLIELQKHVVFDKRNQLNLSRPDRYHLGLARAKKLRRLCIEHGWDVEDYKIAEYLVDEMSPYHLQNAMFATTVREQGSDEQKNYWLPKIENWDIIGCYGQTELGHGSNVKGIECEARWDASSKDFVLHSPTLTASKWWNGSLGRTANHAIVVAQLVLPDVGASGRPRSHGPHQFIVQIRDMKTHQPLDGIVVGDIGPKYGYTSMDNGYLLFDHVHVPHSALLSKYSGVDSEDGTYIKPENPATVYGSMTYVRAQIIMHARLVLARAVTIAVRYTAVRRQFADRDAKEANAREQAVLNYPTVQIRILPLLATTFALHYTGETMYKLYYSTRASIEKSKDFSGLAQMHATSSGLKSLCTMLAADGIETCRRAMGGHGFGGGSGIIPLNNDYLSKPTVEGDNWMITQQTASYLIKRMAKVVQKPSLQPTDAVDVQYFHFLRNKRQNVDYDVLGNDADIVAAFQHRSAYQAHEVYQARLVRKNSWTSLMLHLHHLSRAHSESLLVENFYTAIFVQTPNPTLSVATVNILRNLFRLFALTTLQASAADFILSRTLTADHLSRIMTRIQQLMAEIRPHAVPLVDAWSIPDYLLQSSLGRYDGDVYNDLFHKAHRENPLNEITFNPDWRTPEIIMGEGDAAARERIEALVLGKKSLNRGVKPRL